MTDFSADAQPSSGSDRLALAVSGAGSPFVVLPLFLALLARHEAASRAQAALWSGVAVGGMVGAPLIYVLLAWRRGLVTDLHVRRREQRQGPFAAAIAGCALSALALQAVGASPALVLAAAAAFLNGLVFLAVTLRWKISMHGSVYLACALMAGRLVAPSWYWALLGVPLVMWARVRRGRHTIAQATVAVLLAGAITMACLWVYTTRCAMR
jgi:hypothetical protein